MNGRGIDQLHCCCRTQDQLGNPFTGLALLVTLSIASGPGGAVLSNNTATTSTRNRSGIFSVACAQYSWQPIPSRLSLQEFQLLPVVVLPLPPAATGPPRLVLAPGANKRYFISRNDGPTGVCRRHVPLIHVPGSTDLPGGFDYTGMLTLQQSNWDSPQGGLAKHRMTEYG